jgi:hypothetical protein
MVGLDFGFEGSEDWKGIMLRKVDQRVLPGVEESEDSPAELAIPCFMLSSDVYLSYAVGWDEEATETMPSNERNADGDGGVLSFLIINNFRPGAGLHATSESRGKPSCLAFSCW